MKNDSIPRNGSPVFVARFADGEATRLTTHTSFAKLDVVRGVRLARHAYRSRTGHEPPAIVEARFERADTGECLATYDAKTLGALP
jgi:hypothetical protein